MQQQPPPDRGKWFLEPSRYGLTPANGITAVRLALVPFIAEALLEARFVPAFWMLLAAGLSDAVDGYIARAFGHKSRFGAYLDPIADKILILTLFFILTWAGHLPLWLALLVLGRDVAIVVTVAVFTRMKKTGLRMQPLLVSKLTTFSLVILLLVTLADLAFVLSWEEPRFWLTVAAASFTALSWVAYFFEGLRALREPVPGTAATESGA